MGRVVWKQADAERAIRQQTIAGLTEVGKTGKTFAASLTPVRTGYARRSLFYVVVENGRRVAGDTVDGNGMQAPTTFTNAPNGITVVVGANAPYYIWIEIGARGRRGLFILARAADQMQTAVGYRLQEAKAAWREVA